MYFWNRGRKIRVQMIFTYSFVSELLLKLTIINDYCTTIRCAALLRRTDAMNFRIIWINRWLINNFCTWIRKYIVHGSFHSSK